MTAFRAFLAIFLVVLGVYTAIVAHAHGINLVQVFFGDMARLGWPGQFNLDFMGFLCLAGLWVAWRHDFSVGGLALGVAASMLGMMFMTVYLLAVSFRSGGDMRRMLLGTRRADA